MHQPDKRDHSDTFLSSPDSSLLQKYCGILIKW